MTGYGDCSWRFRGRSASSRRRSIVSGAIVERMRVFEAYVTFLIFALGCWWCIAYPMGAHVGVGRRLDGRDLNGGNGFKDFAGSGRWCTSTLAGSQGLPASAYVGGRAGGRSIPRRAAAADSGAQRAVCAAMGACFCCGLAGLASTAARVLSGGSTRSLGLAFVTTTAGLPAATLVTSELPSTSCGLPEASPTYRWGRRRRLWCGLVGGDAERPGLSVR